MKRNKGASASTQAQRGVLRAREGAIKNRVRHRRQAAGTLCPLKFERAAADDRGDARQTQRDPLRRAASVVPRPAPKLPLAGSAATRTQSTDETIIIRRPLLTPHVPVRERRVLPNEALGASVPL